MQQPPWTAGPRLSHPHRVGGALALSVLAHAVGLAVWVHATQQAAGPASFSQKHGGITVQLIGARAQPEPLKARITPAAEKAQPREARPIAKAPPPVAVTPNARAESRAQATLAPAPSPPAWAASAASSPAREAASPLPETAASEADGAAHSTPPATPAPPPPAAPPAAQAGGRFASLFAPLVSMPMGRGQWRAAPSLRPPQEAMAAMQREQAVAGTRQAVQRQTEQLQQQLQTQPLKDHCDIRLSLERQRAQVRCAAEEDLSRLAAAFQGALQLTPTLPPQPDDSCLAARDRTVAWADCPAALDTDKAP